MLVLLLACAEEPPRPTLSASLDELPDVVSGVVELRGAATSALALTFEIDGVELAGTVATEGAARWDTRRGDDGDHTVTVRARDGGGAERVDEATVWVANHESAPGDVELVSPDEGASACGELTVEAWAAGPVTFSLDGGDLAVADAAPRRWTLDTRGLAAGVHALGATSFLDDGARVTARRSVNVTDGACEPAPTVTLPGEAYAGALDARATLQVDVTDPGGVARVDLSVDGAPYAAATSAPYTFQLPTGLTAPVTLEAAATDTSGQVARTRAVAILDGEDPVAALDAPFDGEAVAGTVAVAWTAEDAEGGVVSQLLLDGEPRHLSRQEAASFDWDTTRETRGEHVLQVRVVDAVGHEAWAEATVAVDNVPRIRWVSPDAGPLDADEVAIEVVTFDDGETPAVTLSADGAPLAEGSTATWDTCAVAPGEHLLTAEAVDDVGQLGVLERVVRVSRPPEVQLVDPPAELTAAFAVATWVRADLPIASITWDADGVPLAAEAVVRDDLPTPCALRCPDRCRALTWTLDATSLAEGDHVVTVTITDTTGHLATASFSAGLTHDQDGDGAAGAAFGGPDCDDADTGVLPGAVETCDGRDEDCDGSVDEDYDLDGDGAFDAATCAAGDDCDDADATVSPTAAESCDGIDNDCDGAVDASAPTATRMATFGGRTSSAADLGDVAANVYEVEHTTTLQAFWVFVDPGGATDLLFRVYAAERNTYTPLASAEVAVSGGPGWYGSGQLDVTLEAGATYAVGVSRQTVVTDWYGTADGAPQAGLTEAGLIFGEPDADGVLYDSAHSGTGLAQRLQLGGAARQDRDLDGDGETPFCGDCDDDDAEASSTAVETCDGRDEDCDGVVDEGWDADGDGFGACLECDDADDAVHPRADEVCGDDVDDDCDGWAPRCEGSGDVPLGDAQATLLGAAGGDGAGHAVAGPGDLDGDGYGDLLVAAPYADDGGSRSGAVYVLRGPVGADRSLADADATWWGEDATDEAGAGLAAVLLPVDLDGDDVSDGIVGAPGDDAGGSNAGAVYLVGAEGGDLGGAAVKRSGPSAYAEVGTSLAAGDLDGDGDADLVAGGADVAWLQLGPLAGTAAFSHASLAAEAAGDDLGASLAVGDLDGDGIAELVLGAPGRGGVGAVYLLGGPLGGSASLRSATRWDGEAAGDEAGAAVASAGDTDGDGYGDLLVGAPGADGGAGLVYLLPGPPDATALSDGSAVLSGDTGGDDLGRAVAGVGDVDGDGLGDVLLGAPGDDRGGAGAGAAWLLYGPTRGLLALGDGGLVLVGEASGDEAGTAVATAGDVDDDGYADFVVGAPASDDAAWDAGAAWLFWEAP